ncbi:MAG: MG2 domain-containing protein, partial [Anaerolineae bacterium]|nr:MG2 domain-containing protein [Anaerolineae bacterium]
MSRKRWLFLGVGVLALGLVVALAGSLFYFARLPEHLSQHETIVLGQSQLVPGSTAAMRVVVRDSRDAAALAGAGVKVLMRPAEGGKALPVYEGTTDATGTLDVSFSVPEDAVPDQVLVVETVSSLGSDRMEKPVTLTRDYRLLVATDKPLYQPGQMIHIRVLALGAFDHRPASGQTVELAVADGKGNTVFRKSLTTSSFGVTSVDFQLAETVNTGPYKIAATLGNTSSEKTVTVEHYTLPKFEVALSTDRDYYRPGDRVEGTLSARYFFGKDVTRSALVIEGYTFDFERVVSVVIDGQTDDQGQFEFAFDLPDYLAGTEFEDGRARFYVEARVIDQAEHAEVGRLSLPVAQQALVIDAIPEGGTFRVGVENILYVLTSTPDGAPAESEIIVTVYDTNETLTAQTGPYGLAELRFTPATAYVSLRIQAQDTTGALADRELWFEGPYDEESVLLRPDAPIYRVGDTMALTILTSQSMGTVYLDIVREGQTVSTRAVDVVAGRAEVAVDLDPALYGTLELHAYKILRSGHIVRDTRLVVVDQAADLSVGLQAGADTYRPGEDAVLDVNVTDPAGTGVQAALGLAIVDEAVFALAEQDPGFAKLYFMLEEELLAPKFELHGFSIPEMITDPCPRSGDDACTPPVLEAQADAGKAALASAISAADPFTLEANSHEQAMARAYDRQQTFYKALATGSFGLFLVLPLAVLVLNGI